jgi:hypothetical protein
MLGFVDSLLFRDTVILDAPKALQKIQHAQRSTVDRRLAHFTALDSFNGTLGFLQLVGPGILRSRPALRAAAAEFVPLQSLIPRPAHFQSPLSTFLRRHWLESARWPLTSLSAVITAMGLASLTTISKA